MRIIVLPQRTDGKGGVEQELRAAIEVVKTAGIKVHGGAQLLHDNTGVLLLPDDADRAIVLEMLNQAGIKAVGS